MTNAEKFKEVFGITPKTICDADSNEWWDEEYEDPEERQAEIRREKWTPF